MARPLALAAAVAAALLAVVGAGGAATQQTPKRGGTVVVNAAGEQPCLNPLLDACIAGSFSDVVDPVLRGAFRLLPSLTWQPYLVSRVDFTRRPPFTLTYHVRPEARWSDGVPITAGDFVFTHDAFAKLVPGDIHRTQVRSIRVLDAKTVSVVLAGRFANWRALFSIVLPRHALRGRDLTQVWMDRIDNPMTGTPIGNGPFLFKRWERGRQLTLVRNKRYWGSHPAFLDELSVRYLGPTGIEELVEAFRTREFDVGVGTVDADTVTAFSRVSGIRVQFAPGRAWEHLELRLGVGGHTALRLKAVRQAIAYGIDRVALVRGILGRLVSGARPLDSAVLLSQGAGYTPNWEGYRFRVARARQLLEEAGCRLGADGIYVCGGEKLSLRFVTTSQFPRRTQTLELAQRQLRRVGVESRIEYVPARVLGQVLEHGQFDLALFSWLYGGTFSPEQIFNCGVELNFTGYCQRLVTSDLNQAERILDVDRRAAILNRADRQLARDVPVIPLFQIPIFGVARSTIRNFVPYQQVRTWNAENWWLER